MEVNPQLPGSYKFVRVNDEYRFCHTQEIHCSLLKIGEKAQSAGNIHVFEDHWNFGSLNYSTSLKIGSDSLDIEKLTDIIGKVCIEKDF